MPYRCFFAFLFQGYLWRCCALLCCGIAFGTVAQAQILIGQTAGMTGVVAPRVKESIEGARLLLDTVNAQGGIHGEKVQLVQLDDGFEPLRAADNARSLIEEHKVAALFLTHGTAHTQAVLEHVNRHNVPLIAPSTGALALHQPVQRHVFNVRPLYRSEAERLARYVTTIGMQRIAVVYTDDSFGRDALQGVQKEFTRAGIEPLLSAAVERTNTDYGPLMPKLLQAQAVIWLHSGEPTAQGIKALRQAGSQALMLTLSSNSSTGFMQALGEAGQGVIVMQVFPDERSMATPLVREAMALAGGKKLTSTMLEGFAGAKVLVEALRRAGPKPTRERLQAALEGLQNYELGGIGVISYSPQNHSGLSYTDLSIIRQGQFMRR